MVDAHTCAMTWWLAMNVAARLGCSSSIIKPVGVREAIHTVQINDWKLIWVYRSEAVKGSSSKELYFQYFQNAIHTITIVFSSCFEVLQCFLPPLQISMNVWILESVVRFASTWKEATNASVMRVIRWTPVQECVRQSVSEIVLCAGEEKLISWALKAPHCWWLLLSGASLSPVLIRLLGQAGVHILIHRANRWSKPWLDLNVHKPYECWYSHSRPLAPSLALQARNLVWSSQTGETSGSWG